MFAELFVFAGKAVIVVGLIAGLVLLVALLIARSQQSHELEVKPLNRKLKDTAFFLKSFRMNKGSRKAEGKKRKEESKKESKDGSRKKALYLLRFKGDLRASHVDSLREEVTAILQGSEPGDEVLCVVESPGGVVHGYGLAAAQLLRLREGGLRLTMSIDQMAASGGYLMSCVGHEIIAAPFAIVGSIGVVAQVPNFHRLLKKHEVDYHEYTAGEYKRTVSIFGEISPKGEEKFLQQLEETHGLFKGFVGRFRPQLNLSQVGTGEYWYGEQALQLGLVDRLLTSDDFVLQKFKEDHLILELKYEKPRSLQDRIAEIVSKSAERTLLRLSSSLERQKFF